MIGELKRNGPLFRQVYRDILARIRAGKLLPGDQLATESELMKQYAVSITTVRKAIQALTDEGVLVKRQGIGTFVLNVPKEKTAVPELRKPYRVGVFLPDANKLTAAGDSRHWYLNVRRLNGIYAKASEKNCTVFVHGFEDKIAHETLDGAIFFPSYAWSLESEDARKRLAAKLETTGIPYVTVSEFDLRFSCKYWMPEMIEIEFFKAVQYLMNQGRRRIVLLGPNLDADNPRCVAYRKALASGGIAYDAALLVENAPSDAASGHAACDQLLLQMKKSGLPDAIFCTTDLQALGVLESLRKHRIRVPEDIAVMGIDNLPESESTGLTSMEFSGTEIGMHALELLLDVLNGTYPAGVVLSYPGRILRRNSA